MAMYWTATMDFYIYTVVWILVGIFIALSGVYTTYLSDKELPGGTEKVDYSKIFIVAGLIIIVFKVLKLFIFTSISTNDYEFLKFYSFFEYLWDLLPILIAFGICFPIIGTMNRKDSGIYLTIVGVIMGFGSILYYIYRILNFYIVYERLNISGELYQLLAISYALTYISGIIMLIIYGIKARDYIILGAPFSLIMHIVGSSLFW